MKKSRKMSRRFIVRVGLMVAIGLMLGPDLHRADAAPPVVVGPPVGPPVATCTAPAPSSGNGICEGNETCETEPGDCGACASTLSDFATCPSVLPACDASAGVDDCCYRKFDKGSLIIPMDRCHQPLSGGGKYADAPTANDAFCKDAPASDNGMFHTYGLVYRLMQQGIPVYWTLNPTKDPTAVRADQNSLAAQVYNDRDIDFWVISGGGLPPQSGGSLNSCVSPGCTPPVARLDPSTLTADLTTYNYKEFPTRGASFIIDSADVPELKAFLQHSASSPDGKDYSGFASNTNYDFSAVNFYEIQDGAEIVYLDYGSAGPAYTPMNRPAAPISTLIDYAPPRLARESPSAVSTNWLGRALLNDPAASGCKNGDFSPSTAVYCDLTMDDIEAGYLTAGGFNWAWLDSWQSGIPAYGDCDASAQVSMIQMQDFMTSVPGIRDGGSVMFFGSAMGVAEICELREPQGNQCGLETSNSVPGNDLIFRYPANIFMQMGDIPLSLSVGSGVNTWDYATNGYRDYDSLARLITKDTGTLCTNHISTTTCDSFSSTGDTTDLASYVRYGDDDANGVAFYMGGNTVNTLPQSGQLRMVLNALIATPNGIGRERPESVATVEVARSTPVVGDLDGSGTVLSIQGTLDVINPAETLTTYSGADDDSTFVFPHFKGHMRAIDIAKAAVAAADPAPPTTLAELDAWPTVPVLFDAANGIPSPSLDGCDAADLYTSGCRTVFTTVTAGDNSDVSSRPKQVYFDTSNLDTIKPLLGDSAVTFTDDEAKVLMGRILAGRDDDGDGAYEAALGGVDRSSVAVALENTDFNFSRPAVAYFGALDGMVHAVCAEVKDYCTSLGQELWAYIPRSNLPLMRLNRQRIDGSMTLSDVYGDFDGTGISTFKSILTFQIANPVQVAGIAGQEPAVIAIDVTVPNKPTVLWEVNAPATRGTYELGIGVDTAAGNVSVGGATKNLTFVATTNGGTGGTGALVLGIDTVTGAETWRWEHAYPTRSSGDSGVKVPVDGIPMGVSAYDETGTGRLTHVLVPTLFGQVYKLNAADGSNSLGSGVALFSFSSDLHPIGAPAAVFREQGGSNRLIGVIGSGGYTAPGRSLVWAPDKDYTTGAAVTQYVVGFDLAGSTTVSETTAAFKIALAAGKRIFSQPTIAGDELFFVTETANVNDFGYGASGANTGTVNQFAATGSLTGTPTATATFTARGGSGSVAVDQASGTVVVGGGSPSPGVGTATLDTGTDITVGISVDSTRLLWLRLR